MYTLYIRWVIYDPEQRCIEMNFEVMPIKGYAQIEAGNAQNLFFRCQTFFRNKKETDIWSSAFSTLRKYLKKECAEHEWSKGIILRFNCETHETDITCLFKALRAIFIRILEAFYNKPLLKF